MAEEFMDYLQNQNRFLGLTILCIVIVMMLGIMGMDWMLAVVLMLVLTANFILLRKRLYAENKQKNSKKADVAEIKQP